MTRKPWELPFLAEPAEVAGLRRAMRLHLRLWGLSGVVDAAEICVSELVANVIRHVGDGMPATLVVEMNGTHLRVGLRDPGTRVLPTLVHAGLDDESGRGMALLDAVSDRWGVILGAESKLVWCDLATSLLTPNGHDDDRRVAKGEACLTLYSGSYGEGGRAGVAVIEEAAIELITDLLHWLRVHGSDVDEALDGAQTHFETETVQPESECLMERVWI
ncbi:ATP-binding protein [Streptomyces sp. NBC_01022]|uniref:ATP-binding protein n=1 Tax=Streptomyces sp. NBC_01022 TaxID=2903723 RepID=UPI002DD9DE5B|nr:ATP-binding protein [Streptomyces sp. NBC_01022]WRZ81958.1 ATP-binding protein [Streptomyces sp. NBC_01022]